MPWTNRDTLEFLELYKKEACIWDPKHKMHKSKHASVDAWNRIRRQFSVPCTVEELKKKKESLMTTFRYHLHKKRASVKSNAAPDEVYRTNWFAYNTMDSFLTPIYQCKRTFNTTVPETEVMFPQVEMEDSSDDATNPSTSLSRHSSSGLRKKQLQETIAIKRKLDETISMFQTVSEASKKTQELDECDLYGQLLAKRLKSFDENTRDSIMLQIDNIMYDAKQKYINLARFSP